MTPWLDLLTIVSDISQQKNANGIYDLRMDN